MDKIDKLANVLNTTPPSSGSKTTDLDIARNFFESICLQLIVILKESEFPIYQYLSANIALKMAVKRPKMMEALFFNPIMSEFAQYAGQILHDEHTTDLSGLPILVDSVRLSTSVSVMQNILLANEPSDSFIHTMSNLIFAPIYQLYIKSNEFKTCLTKELFNLLQVILHFLEFKQQSLILMNLCEDSYLNCACQIKPQNGGLCFVYDLTNKYAHIIMLETL
jgi:hypothetical protein